MRSAQQRRAPGQQWRARGRSLRRRCALCHISRASVRSRPRLGRPEQNQHVLDHLRRIARTPPRDGSRRAHVLVGRDVPGVTVKRVHRRWRQEQLRLPKRRPRRRRDRKGLPTVTAAYPNHVWTYDVRHAACANGQRLKLLTVTDEFTRESYAIAAATTMRARGVGQVRERLIAHHGAPA